MVGIDPSIWNYSGVHQHVLFLYSYIFRQQTDSPGGESLWCASFRFWKFAKYPTFLPVFLLQDGLDHEEGGGNIRSQRPVRPAQACRQTLLILQNWHTNIIYICSLSAHAVPQPLDSANSPKIPTVAQVENIAGVINPGHSLDSLDTADEEDHAPPPVQKYCLCAEPGKGLADTAATKAACGGFTKKINGSRKSPGGGAFTSVSPHFTWCPNCPSRCRC